MKYNSKTQSDVGLDFDGAKLMKVDRDSKRYHTNAWSGHANDGRLVQMGQQPNRKGNDGSCHHSGMAQGGKKPATSPTPSLPAQGSVRDSINRGSQHRGAGGTQVRHPASLDKINAGSGPRKGNQQ